MKETQESSSLVDFFKTVVKLKTIQRQGWKDKLALKNPESVADHCYSMSLMVLVVSEIKNLDTLKMVKMALIHDLAETITGDITPEMFTKSKKERLENSAMKKILKQIPSSIRLDFSNLWNEYQKNSTKEARLLHQIDKLEMAVQASVYNKKGIPKTSLKPFLKSAEIDVKDPDLKKILSKFL
ncbi:MAG TPA: HD domain-containing protein [Candidatus Nitrosotenuis sp.]|nr:HD domain-containing protein [Candidatus Nitrosotenuis sp.]